MTNLNTEPLMSLPTFIIGFLGILFIAVIVSDYFFEGEDNE